MRTMALYKTQLDFHEKEFIAHLHFCEVQQYL